MHASSPRGDDAHESLGEEEEVDAHQDDEPAVHTLDVAVVTSMCRLITVTVGVTLRLTVRTHRLEVARKNIVHCDLYYILYIYIILYILHYTLYYIIYIYIYIYIYIHIYIYIYISDESAPQPNLLKSRVMGTLLGMLGVNNTDI